jgi:cell division protein FtsB
MHEETAFFFICVTAIIAGAVLILNLIRGRQRIAELRALASHGTESPREIEFLSRENEGLRGKVQRLEERLSVLERIATDPAERTAREIESLR